MTTKQQIAAAPKFTFEVMGLGFIADNQPLSGLPKFTKKPAKAMQYAVGFDDVESKSQYWASMGKLHFNQLSIFQIVYL